MSNNYQKELIKNILKRLQGYGLKNLTDRNNKPLYLGDRVNFYFYPENKNEYTPGTIKYDIIKDDYYIEIFASGSTGNNNDNNKLYLEINKIENDKSFDQIEKIDDSKYNQYEYFKQLLENNPIPLEFFKEVLKSANNSKISLSTKELEYIKTYAKKSIPQFNLNVIVNIDILDLDYEKYLLNNSEMKNRLESLNEVIKNSLGMIFDLDLCKDFNVNVKSTKNVI